jgi:hypothetical protein
MNREPTLFYLIQNSGENQEKFRATTCFTIGILLENSDTISKWQGQLEKITKCLGECDSPNKVGGKSPNKEKPSS